VALAFRGVTVALSRTSERQLALADVNLLVPDGECVAVLGGNGAGKSMLLKVAAGALPPSAGTVELSGVPPQRVPGGSIAWMARDADAGLVGATVEDHVGFFAPRADRLAEVWERFHLSALRHRAVDTLSAGEQQRVQLAGWFVGGASLWLMDEPTGWLDPTAAAEVRTVIRDVKTGGATMLIATHDWEDVRIADRVVVLAAGRVVWDGPREEAAALEDTRWGVPTSPVYATGRELAKRGAAICPSDDPRNLYQWFRSAWR